jgi:cell division protein FtsQ
LDKYKIGAYDWSRSFLFSFTSKRNGHRKLKKSEVFFVGENTLFIKQETVNKLLIEYNENASSIEKIN